MVQTHRAAAGRGGWLRLVAPMAQVRRTLEITNLTRLLGVYATVADATGQGRVLASNAGRSERMRGMRWKLRSGGGQLVAHSSELPYPHGSSTVTLTPTR